MEIAALLDNKLFVAVSAAMFGALFTLISQSLSNRRALFSYRVFHSRVGLSTDDAIYGSVKVFWNNNPVSHLFLSTIELTNQSARDFESVQVRVFSTDTALLSQRTEIVGTTRHVEFTEDYRNKISVPEGEQPRIDQFELYNRQRDYILPILNRGQVVRLQLLNAPYSDDQPCIWLDVLHKGVKCKFEIPQSFIFGVPQQDAALIGTILSLLVILLIVNFAASVTTASLLSFVVGWLVLVPGAITIRCAQRIRDFFAG
jgi:hypothetical protein